MSKSYKKTPIVKDHGTGNSGKRFANKSVRRYADIIPNGKGYKKIFCSYDIHDYVSRYTYEEHKQKFESDLKAFLNGGSKYDPREDSTFNHRYDDNRWERFFRRK